VTATDRDDSGTQRAITQEWLRAIAGIRSRKAYDQRRQSYDRKRYRDYED
jgi:hypothetical protein